MLDQRLLLVALLEELLDRLGTVVDQVLGLRIELSLRDVSDVLARMDIELVVPHLDLEWVLEYRVNYLGGFELADKLLVQTSSKLENFFLEGFLPGSEDLFAEEVLAMLGVEINHELRLVLGDPGHEAPFVVVMVIRQSHELPELANCE